MFYICGIVFFTCGQASGIVGSVSDSRARGHGCNTQSSHILSFLNLLIQEGHLSVTGESMFTKYWLTAKEV